MGNDGSFLYVCLCKGDFVVDEDILLADLIDNECDYDGYARFNSNLWTPPAIDGNGDGFTLSPAIVFQKAAGIVENTVYIAFLISDNGSDPIELIQAERLTDPVLMSAPTDQIPLRWLLRDRNI